jgi:membrane fusion protein, multidrug efflux system
MIRLINLALVSMLSAILSFVITSSVLAQALTPVSTTQEPPISARGLVKSAGESTLSTELIAPILRITKREGEAFQKGDVLVQFDCRRFNAELASAEAEYEATYAVAQNNRNLKRYGAVGGTDLAISDAKARKARADADVLKVKVSNCVIFAPFDGRIVEKMVNEHEIPTALSPLLKIVDDTRLEIDLIVSSRLLNNLQIDGVFSFAIDETGKTYQAKLNRIGAVVDAVSQTVRVSGVFIEPRPQNVKPGMSGKAEFETAKR